MTSRNSVQNYERFWEIVQRAHWDERQALDALLEAAIESHATDQIIDYVHDKALEATL